MTPAPFDETDMRRMRGRFASGVTAVTTRTPEGALRGVTVSAFAAVSLAPPLVLIVLANETTTLDRIQDSGLFAINILSDDQEFLAERFAARAPLVDENLTGVPHHAEVTGAPILDEALAWYDCQVESTIPGGDHTIVIGRVQALGWNDERQPLLYYANRYHRLRE